MRSFETGFTLVEVIVALLVSTLVVMVVFSGLGIAFDAWTVTAERIEALDSERQERQILRRQIEGALPLQWIEEDGLTRTPKLGFEGTSRSIRFVSRATLGIGPSGPARWIEWSAGDDGIVVEERDILPPDNIAAPDPAWTGLLAAGHGPVEFAFLHPGSASDPAGTPGEWVTTWDPSVERFPPAAVRVRSRERTGVQGGGSVWFLVSLEFADTASVGGLE
jgi:general secretion pathway protein J